MSNDKVLIDVTPPAGEEERVDRIFKMAEKMIGAVPPPMRLYGVSPPLLESFAGTVGYFRGGTALSPQLTTLIRYLTSESADCKFCIGFNEGFLRDMGATPEELEKVRADISQAPLIEAREVPLLRLALAAVDDPQRDKTEMVEAARAAGWGDREIFDAVMQAASNRALNFALKAFNVESAESVV